MVSLTGQIFGQVRVNFHTFPSQNWPNYEGEGLGLTGFDHGQDFGTA